MADNLKLIEERIDIDIDPNGAPGSILAENHNGIDKEILRKTGKYVGFPFVAKKESTLFPTGTFSWNANAMNVVTPFVITTSKLTSDLTDFVRVLNTMEAGDLFQFKDYSGRSVFLEFQSYATGTDASMNALYNITVKGFSDNLNYMYQVNETSVAILSGIKKISPATGKLDAGDYVGDAGLLNDRIEVLEALQNLKTNFTGQAYAIWTGTGLDFNVIYPNYYILGVLYPGATQTITLDPADPTNPRLDIIAVDATGAIKKTGVASADPATPAVDSETEIQITTILVGAGATVPGNVTEDVVYKENTERTNTTNSGAIDFNSIVGPFQGTKCIDCTGFTAGANMKFTAAVLSPVTDYSTVSFFVSLKAVFANTARFYVRFLKNGVVASSTVEVVSGTYNFNRNTINIYQQVIIPRTVFSFTTGDVNGLEIFMLGSNAFGFKMDNIVLSKAADSSSPLQKAIVSIVTPNGVANATTENDTLEFKSVSPSLFISAAGKVVTFDVLDNIPLACSDETSNLTVGNLISFHMPFAMLLTEVRLTVNEAPTLTNIIVDIKEGGVSLFSTLPSIDVTELTSVTAAVPAVISDPNLADNALITISTVQIGSTNTGKGLKVTLKGKRV